VTTGRPVDREKEESEKRKDLRTDVNECERICDAEIARKRKRNEEKERRFRIHLHQ